MDSILGYYRRRAARLRKKGVRMDAGVGWIYGKAKKLGIDY